MFAGPEINKDRRFPGTPAEEGGRFPRQTWTKWHKWVRPVRAEKTQLLISIWRDSRSTGNQRNAHLSYNLTHFKIIGLIQMGNCIMYQVPKRMWRNGSCSGECGILCTSAPAPGGPQRQAYTTRCGGCLALGGVPVQWPVSPQAEVSWPGSRQSHHGEVESSAAIITLNMTGSTEK